MTEIEKETCSYCSLMYSTIYEGKCPRCGVQNKQKTEAEKRLIEISDLEKKKLRELLVKIHNDTAPRLPVLWKAQKQLDELQTGAYNAKDQLKSEFDTQFIKEVKQAREKYDEKRKELESEIDQVDEQLKKVKADIKTIQDEFGKKRKTIADIVRLLDDLNLDLQGTVQL